MHEVDMRRATVLIRNHRIVGDELGRPVREYLDDDDWADIEDQLIACLAPAFGVGAFRFVGIGWDPGWTSPDDEEAIERSETLAAVVEVEPDRFDELRGLVHEFLLEHRLDQCWFVVADGSDITLWAGDPPCRHGDAVPDG